MDNEIEKRFGYKKPGPEQIAAMDKLGKDILWPASQIDYDVPDSREKSLALTHLEEVRHWVNQAIATRWT